MITLARQPVNISIMKNLGPILKDTVKTILAYRKQRESYFKEAYQLTLIREGDHWVNMPEVKIERRLDPI